MEKIITAEQMRALERHIIEKQQVPSLILMENAGRSVAECVHKHTASGSRVLVVCGLGNNGGDGYVAARHLLMSGRLAFIWSIGDPKRLAGDARTSYEAAVGSGVPVTAIADEQSLRSAIAEADDVDAVVDALFGIGLDRPLEGIHLAAVKWLNSLDTQVFAVDIPSGINADSGAVMGDAVRAAFTVTFQNAKMGHLLFPGRTHAGRLIVAPIGVVSPNHLSPATAERLSHGDLNALLPPRRPDAHKGEYGRALLIAGSAGMMGAGVMAARSAVRSGVGVLTVCAPASAAPALWSAVPEALAFAIPDKDGKFSSHSVEAVKPLLEGKTCAAIGPGIGHSPGHIELIRMLLCAQIPLVIDADGLNALSEDVEALKAAKADVVLTPHPGEMARLTKATLAEVLAGPVERAKAFAKKTGATVLLKGATSVIASADGRVTLNTTGSPALAKGGSGDVLTGLILALLAQGLPGYEAARLGALLLGVAAQSVEQPDETVLPTDVIEALPKAFLRI